MIKNSICLIKEIPKVDSNLTCLAVINLDSALKCFDECQYMEKKVLGISNS